ncbi:MAG: HD domain-containing protein [Defluviitaleaceae bacterium]|nr:HD domain-containing protein [Defluviitaleaceae bacterium]
MRYIEDFKEGENIVAHYLCKKKDVMKTKSGKNYMSMILADRTGTAVAKAWTLNNDIQSFDAGDFIKIEATVVTYLDEMQLNVRKIRKSQTGEYLPADYIPTTDQDVGAIYAAVCGLIDSLENPHLKEMMTNIFVDDKEISGAFLRHSAAKNMHHSYMGGLCEHTLNVAQICEFLAPRYKFVNRDVLISAALLHDIGKIYELSDFPENDYTDTGQLLGHITITSELIAARAAAVSGFPPVLKNLLQHCILSHHGRHEYGSPILPKTIEAMILSYADITDAHIKMFEEALEKGPAQADWAGYNRVLARDIRKSNF